MPRRPRPTSRRPPPTAAPAKVLSGKPPVPKTAASKPSRRPLPEDPDSEASSSRSGPGRSSQSGSSDEGSSASEPEDDDENALDADAPRVVQWVDEEDIDGIPDDESSGSSSAEEDEGDKSHLEADLNSFSFGALRKAQRALTQARVDTDSDGGDSEDSYESGPEETSAMIPTSAKGKEREDERVREKKEIAKRKHKHAPAELSSRRPVSRKRFVAENTLVARDPRFLPITGEFSSQRFQQQYGFLSEMHVNEMKTLRDNLKRAKKMLASSPRDLREERVAEVERLERAVKRAESSVNKDRQARVESEAITKATKAERLQRQEGKGAWFMKEKDKKELLLRAKYEDLAQSGGRSAVRKAIEKKQKKVGQKEKKRRPFPASGRDGGPIRKRPHAQTDSGRAPKRQRQS